jgi:hypothetical protein
MASSVGHAMAGACLYLLAGETVEEGRGRAAVAQGGRARGILFYAFLANLPDVDFIAGMALYGRANALHGMVTHSIAFAVVAAAVAAVLRRAGGYGFLGSLCVYALTVASHDVMDALSGRAVGFTGGEGVALLYPFVERKISLPVSLFHGVRHRDLSQLASMENLLVVFVEILVFAPLITAIARLKRGRPR